MSKGVEAPVQLREETTIVRINVNPKGAVLTPRKQAIRRAMQWPQAPMVDNSLERPCIHRRSLSAAPTD
jgi:hypothetical protein